MTWKVAWLRLWLRSTIVRRRVSGFNRRGDVTTSQLDVLRDVRQVLVGMPLLYHVLEPLLQRCHATLIYAIGVPTLTKGNDFDHVMERLAIYIVLLCDLALDRCSDGMSAP